MKQGRLGYNSSNDRYGLYHQIYGLIQDFIAEKVWKFWLMISGYGQEWR